MASLLSLSLPPSLSLSLSLSLFLSLSLSPFPSVSRAIVRLRHYAPMTLMILAELRVCARAALCEKPTRVRGMLGATATATAAFSTSPREPGPFTASSNLAAALSLARASPRTSPGLAAARASVGENSIERSPTRVSNRRETGGT